MPGHMMVEQNRRTLKNFVKFVDLMAHSFDLDLEDYTIILNALHYYKKVDKKGNFQQYDDERINALRDKMAKQVTNFFG